MLRPEVQYGLLLIIRVLQAQINVDVDVAVAPWWWNLGGQVYGS